MADNTTRPSTSGGDVIRSEDETSQKTQVFKADPATSFVSGDAAVAVFQALRDSKRQRLDLLRTFSAGQRHGAGAPPPPPPPAGWVDVTIQSILGSRLYRWYRDYTVGTYACVLGSGDATQGTAANQPAAGTFTGGNSYADLDGAAGPNNDTLNSSAITTLPTYAAGDSFLNGCAVRVDSNPDGTAFIWNNGGTVESMYVNTGNTLTIGNAISTDSPVVGAGWLRIIGHHDGTGNVLYLFVNGVQQTATATASTTGWPDQWKTNSFTFGGDAADRYDGAMACMFFARSASAFSAQDISDLDAALLRFIS